MLGENTDENTKKSCESYEEMIDKNLPQDITILGPEEIVTPVKRGRGRPRKTDKGGATGNYFDPVEQNLMNYLNATSESERNKIFNKYIYSPMYSMIQTILMKYYHNKFQIDEPIEDIISDTFSFIVTKLDKFKPERGCKAYSYIQTVIKHYIGSKYVGFKKQQERYTPIQNVYGEVQNHSYQDDSHTTSFAGELIQRTIKDIEGAIQDSEKYNLTEKDKHVGMCLVDILNNWEDCIDMGSQKLNKNSILFQISEQTFFDNKTVRNAIKKFKTIYQDSKRSLLSTY